MKPIDVIIGGAQKAGTSSLKYYLGQHPDIATHSQSEFTPIIYKSDFLENYSEYYNTFFSHQNQSGGKLILAKSVTVMSSRKYLQLLIKHNPHIKIILILRNPVDRAYSAFWYAKRMGWETSRTFKIPIISKMENSLNVNNLDYIDAGCYYKKIKNFQKIIPKENLRIFTFDEFISSALKVCCDIFKFIKVDESFIPDTQRAENRAAIARFSLFNRFLTVPRKTGVKNFFPHKLHPYIDSIKSSLIKFNEKKYTQPKLDENTKKILIEYYKPHNLELETLIGKDLSSWNK